VTGISSESELPRAIRADNPISNVSDVQVRSTSGITTRSGQAPPERRAETATPPPGRTDEPSTGSTPSTPRGRTFLWAATPAATRYEVAFYRDDRLVLVAQTTRTQLRLASEWTYQGRKYSLEPGSYRWYVWPLRRESGRFVRLDPIVQATFREEA
jgi:hypothetical protein